jgi:uracil-DNA glycosylase family 4
MVRPMSDMSPAAAAAALEWLAEMGADEVIGEVAVDRFVDRPTAKAATAAATVAPVVVSAARAEAAGDARALAAACRSLADIERTLSTFEACPLRKTATNLCFSDGNPAAQVMIVGEAPGRDEDIAGKPFVGRSGQLLDRMLAAIGLSRRSEDPATAVFITNTIFWRPPGNREPTEAETLMCLPFLLRAIEIQKPRYILCAGKTSFQRLTGRSDGIMKARGVWLRFAAGETAIPLMATLHPAYLLRNPAHKRLAWRDLLTLRQALDAH